MNARARRSVRPSGATVLQALEYAHRRLTAARGDLPLTLRIIAEAAQTVTGGAGASLLELAGDELRFVVATGCLSGLEGSACRLDESRAGPEPGGDPAGLDPQADPRVGRALADELGGGAFLTAGLEGDGSEAGDGCPARMLLAVGGGGSRFDEADRAALGLLAEIGGSAIGYAQALAEKQAIAAQSQTSQARLDELLSHLPLSLFSMDADGTITASLGRGLGKTGLREGEWVGRSIFELYGDDETFVDHARRALAGASGEVELSVGGRHLQTRYRAVVENGEVKAVHGFWLDITEAREAEIQLQEYRSRLFAILTQAPVFLFSVDPEGIVTLLEGHAPLGLRGVEGELVGRSIWDVFAGNQRIIGAYRRAFTGRRTRTVVRFEEKDGGRDYEILLSPAADAAGRISVSGLAIDVTERRLAEEARRESETKTRFLARMSHELRTPLNAILGFAQLLQGEQYGRLNERQARYVKNILTSGNHLLGVVNEVLDLAKVSSGRVDLSIEPVSVSSVMHECASLCSAAAEGGGLRLVTQTTSLQVRADRTRLRQILLNLISNAIKFTPRGGEVSISAEHEEGQVAIQVTDTGMGIPEDQVDAIFEEFVQVGDADRRTGTGLGLAISRRLAELMGGKLTVSSEIGVGSRFTLSLPAVR